jgi:hypothetical protein
VGVDRKTNKKAQWQGSGLARLTGDRIGVLHVREDYWGQLVDLGRLPDIPEDDITGVWKGTVLGIPFTAELTQEGTKVTGTLNVLGQSVPVSGTNTPPNVSLSGSSGGQQMSFRGIWQDEDQIVGTLAGAGLNEQVTLDRE